jgi:hypothetical protein
MSNLCWPCYGGKLLPRLRLGSLLLSIINAVRLFLTKKEYNTNLKTHN